jgi:hypothetical protein
VNLNGHDLEYVSHLQSYLDRLIKLQENGHTVFREVNEVLGKINKIYRIGDLPSMFDLVSELEKRFDAESYLAGNAFSSNVTKAALWLEFENGDVKTIDIDIPSTVVVVSNSK